MADDKTKEIDVVVSDPQPGIEIKGEESSGTSVTWTGVTVATVNTPAYYCHYFSYCRPTSRHQCSLRGFRLSSGDPVQLLESLNRGLRIRGQVPTFLWIYICN